MGCPADMHHPEAFVDRLCRATNEHNLEALSLCFAPAYRNETPVHPARGFHGRAQVRKNWEQIFAAVPDITAEVRWVANGSEVWSEWEMRGSRRDGSRHLMRGVVIFGVDHGQASWARFYLEPVQEGGASVDETVRAQVGTDSDTQIGTPSDGPRAGS